MVDDSLDAIFSMIRLRKEFEPPFQRNAEDARRELDILIRIIQPILEDCSVSPSKQNAALQDINTLSRRLNVALANGRLALLQALDIVDGKAFDAEGTSARGFDLMSRLERDLIELRALTETTLETRSGPRENVPRMIALARCAAYYERWTGHVPSRNLAFSNFCAAVFEHLGLRRSSDMRAQIRKIERLRSQGINLEIWSG